MSLVTCDIAASVDGYVAGPNQTQQEPLGTGGEALHDWVVALKQWREPQGMDGGEENASSPVVMEEYANVGAEIMGRGKFGPPAIPGAAGGATTRHSTSRSSCSPITLESRSPCRTRPSPS